MFRCSNLHGFWEGPAVQVPTSDVAVLQETLKSVVIDGECTVSDFPESAWPSVHADFVRLQAQVFLSEVPFTEDKGVKHVPYINVNDDGTSSILVGKVGEAIHPMNGVTDDGATDPHWITELYVTDQDGNIVAMKSLDPTGVTEATWTFETPEGASTLQAYSWCNIHGLYVGPIVEVTTTKEATTDASVGKPVTAMDGKNSGTIAVVSFIIGSVVTLVALQM